MPQPDPIAINPCFVKEHSQWADVAFSLNPKKAKTSIPLPRRPTARPPQLSGTHTTARGERRGGADRRLASARRRRSSSPSPAPSRLPAADMPPPPCCSEQPRRSGGRGGGGAPASASRRSALSPRRRSTTAWSGAVAVSARPALCGGGKEERGEREGKVKEK